MTLEGENTAVAMIKQLSQVTGTAGCFGGREGAGGVLAASCDAAAVHGAEAQRKKKEEEGKEENKIESQDATATSPLKQLTC